MIDQASLRELQAIKRRLNILIALNAIPFGSMGGTDDLLAQGQRRFHQANMLEKTIQDVLGPDE